MGINEVKKQYIKRDRLVRAMDKDGKFRISIIKNSDAARTAQEKHQLPVLAAFLLARQLSAASLMSSFLKGEERIILDAQGKGPITKVFAEAISAGEVRGYVDFDNELYNYNSSKIEDLMGVGLYSVVRILYNEQEPITGIVELSKGDIQSDLAYYLVRSEQIKSAVLLDVDFNDDGIIKNSGGIIIQAMPGASEEDLNQIFKVISNMPPLTSFFDEGLNPQQILSRILPFEFDILKTTQIDFYCRCSKESFIKKIITLNTNEILEMKENNNRELVCRYCSKKYYLEDADFDTIIADINAKLN